MKKQNNDKKLKTDLNPEQNTEAESDRRRFFKKFGKYAVYTPPAIYLLMAPHKEAVAGSALNDGGPF